jgi:signal transduction histidine kinase
MFKTLNTKLSAVLVTLLCLVTGLYAAVTLYTSQFYFQEVGQRLNRTLAENLIADRRLSIRDDLFDGRAVKEIFHTYMVINPAIEVYLLDAGGKLLAYSAPPDKIRLERIDLGPVRDFLDDAEPGLVLGDDPRDPGNRKPFSAAPIGAEQNPEGYLYVVLAGEQFRSAADMLRSSYIIQLGIWALAASLVFGVIAGIVIFYFLTRRLRRLDAAMTSFREGPLDIHTSPIHLDVESRDELGRLGRTFIGMAERIRQQVDRLKETDRLRRELVANVSHDLRTPITSMQGYLETLLLKEDSLSQGERTGYLNSALKQCRRLSKLVSELFELAKLDSGHTRLHCEPFAMGELVQDVALKFQLRAERQGIDLHTRIAKELPFVYADIALIERVLDNLIDNALRHTPERGKVEIILDQSGSGVSVQIADTGCGIPPEELQHIFDRFYQVQKNENQASGGAGLGLAIAKRILDLHASRLAVDTVPQRGTRFGFALPATA